MWKYVANDNFPEKMFWLAVLRRAIFDYVLYKGVGSWTLDWKLAKKFIFDNNVKCPDGLTCTEICGLFGWDVEYIRLLVKKLSRADVRKLESSKFKEEFLADSLSVIVSSFTKWKVASVVTPFMISRQYAKKYRSVLIPKIIPFYKPATSTPLKISWEISL